MIHNNNCDGAHCKRATGEVRRLPSGGDGAVILCRDCFRHEMAWRESRNRTLDPRAKFPIVEWESVPVYEGCQNAN